MDAKAEPRIISIDRLDNAAVVSFDDGKTARYSAALLYAMLPQAGAMPDADSSDDQLPHSG
jgi:hypothetical protein